jgi:hypothetical protein
MSPVRIPGQDKGCLRPVFFPQPLEAAVRRIREWFRFPCIRVALAQAGISSIVQYDGVAFLAAEKHPPCMRASAALNLVPAPTVRSHCLLQVADPQFAVMRGQTAQEARVLRISTKPLVHLYLHLLPSGKVVQVAAVGVGLSGTRQLVQTRHAGMRQIPEDVEDGAVKFS